MRRLSRENRRALLSAVGKRRAQRIAPVALSADSTPRSICSRDALVVERGRPGGRLRYQERVRLTCEARGKSTSVPSLNGMSTDSTLVPATSPWRTRPNASRAFFAYEYVRRCVRTWGV